MNKRKKNRGISKFLRGVSIILVTTVCVLSVYSNGTSPEAEINQTPPPTTTEASTSIVPTPPPTPTPTPTPEPTPEFFEITMVGDNTIASDAYRQGTEHSYENRMGDDYGYAFAKTIEYFNDDDFTLANLECALTESTDASNKSFLFKAPPEHAKVFSEGSVEFASLGNNHVLDYGEEGYADTKAALDAVGVAYAGRDEYTIYETESGLTVGVYAVSFGSTQDVIDGVTALKEEGAELIIAAIHWGDEGSYTPNKTQYTQGRAAIDAGAHIVYGSHTHTLQEIEEYNDGYIYYSLGNWSFGGNTHPRDYDTIIAKITVMRDVDGTISLYDREEIPCQISSTTSYNDYQPFPYEVGSEEYERTLSKVDGTYDGANLAINYEYTIGEVLG